MSKESATKVAQPIPAIKILPPHITKLIKEEDEETWISGEELYTEGSSDEENCKCKDESLSSATKELTLTSSKSHHSKSKADKKTRTQSPLANLNLQSSSSKDELSSKNSIASDDDEDEEISWKANRGSGVLSCASSVFAQTKDEVS